MHSKIISATRQNDIPHWIHFCLFDQEKMKNCLWSQSLEIGERWDFCLYIPVDFYNQEQALL